MQRSRPTVRPSRHPLRSLVRLAGVALPVGLAAAPAHAFNDRPHAFTIDDRGAAGLYALYPPNLFAHTVGLLQLQITNVGMIGNTEIDALSAGWRGHEYLYEAGLWVGARRSDGTPAVSTTVHDWEFLPPPDPVWTVYPSYEGARGGNRLGFSSAPAQQFHDGTGNVVTSGANDDWYGGVDHRIDEDFLNGFDDDGDGLVDEDFEAIGQEMLSTQYWDMSPIAQNESPDHEPLGLLVQQRSFAWSTPGIDEFIGFDFTVRNIGRETLNDVYLAFYVDSDVGPLTDPGYWVDDLGGFVHIDTTLSDDDAVGGCARRSMTLDIAYMFDKPDAEIVDGVRGGDAPGFFGGMFLGHTTDPFGVDAPRTIGIRRAVFFNSREPYPDGDPVNDIERYDLISQSGVPTRETLEEGDYRYVFSAGPFRVLPPDTTLTFQTAFVIGDGRRGLVRNAVEAKRVFEGTWRDVDQNPATGVDGREVCLRPDGDAGVVFWSDPCDTTSGGPPQLIDWPGYCAPELYVDADCEPCTPTPLASEPGAETRVRWVGTVAPAPPVTNTDGLTVSVLSPGSQSGAVRPPLGGRPPAGDGRVVLEWDNQSELRADPVKRRNLFEGYRVWRVEGWRRPVGSTGPAPDDWQLIAEFRHHPIDAPDTCWVPSPVMAGEHVPVVFGDAVLGNWDPGPSDLLPEDPCAACPDFCWPNRHFRVDDTLLPIESGIATGDTTAGHEFADLYPVGRYTFVDDASLKNGMVYFYDVTAFSAWDEVIIRYTGSVPDTIVQHFELAGRPSARETQMVVPTWGASERQSGVFVVPNPFVQNDLSVTPWGWQLTPSDADPTGTRIAFAGLPEGHNVITIFTLAGERVQTIEHTSWGEHGTAFWNLVSRNGQDVTAGVYLFSVRTEGRGNQVGRFTIIR